MVREANEICKMLPAGLPKAIFEGRFWTLFFCKCLILFGSPGRIRTSDQPVNSRLLYR